jgi:hypothetical protein
MSRSSDGVDSTTSWQLIHTVETNSAPPSAGKSIPMCRPHGRPHTPESRPSHRHLPNMPHVAAPKEVERKETARTPSVRVDLQQGRPDPESGGRDEAHRRRGR